MNNTNFVEMSTRQKLDALADVIYKRSNMQLNPMLCRHIASQLDLTRQAKIDMVSLEDLKRHSVCRQCAEFKEGVLSALSSTTLDTLLGAVEYGEEFIVIQDGVSTVQKSTPSYVKQLPVVIVSTMIDFGNNAYNKSNVYICY